ncbi:MAG: YybS family protein [Deltaproteobacteria bacterium]|nr:YybS family protein [Deltaproteobacteria bacterium]
MIIYKHVACHQGEKKIVPQTVQENVSRDIISGIAIIVVIFTVSIYLPVIGFFFSLFIPLPILFYRSKVGRKTGIIVYILSIIMMIVITGRISLDIFFFVELLLLGFVLGELIEMRLSIEKTISYACASVLIAGIIILFFYSNLSNTEIYTLVSEYISRNLDLTMAMYESMGVSDESIHVISNSMEKIQYVLLRIIPAMLISLILFVSWLSLLIAKPILKAKNIFSPDFGSLNLWQAPEFMVWIFIGCGAALILSDNTFNLLGLNGLIVLMTIYFFQGIAIVSFYFEKKNVPRIFRIFLYSVLALQQLVLLFVIGLGFFDMWLNFRKLDAKN